MGIPRQVVIGDIHGCHRELVELCDKLAINADASPARPTAVPGVARPARSGCPRPAVPDAAQARRDRGAARLRTTRATNATAALELDLDPSTVGPDLDDLDLLALLVVVALEPAAEFPICVVPLLERLRRGAHVVA